MAYTAVVHRRFSLAVVIAALSASSAASASAARLVYQRGAGAERCADERALRQAIARRVGHDPFDPQAPITISVDLTSNGPHLHGRVVVVDADGSEKGAQTLESAGANCDDLLASMALAVSVIIDFQLEPKTTSEDPIPPPTSQDVPPPVAPVVLPPPSPTEKKDAPPLPLDSRTTPPRALSLWAAFGTRASAGAWSAVALGPDLIVELRKGPFGIALEGRYDRTTVDVDSIAEAPVNRVTGSLLPCGHLGWVVTCGIAAFGGTWARGDVSFPTTASAPYLAFGGRLGIEVPIVSKVQLLGTMDVVGITTPTTVVVHQAAATVPGSTVVNTGSSKSQGGVVEASAGIALIAPIL